MSLTRIYTGNFQYPAVLRNAPILSTLISDVVSSLECFSDVRGFQQTHCPSTRGFKTCFTKINNGKAVVIREFGRWWVVVVVMNYLNKSVNMEVSM